MTQENKELLLKDLCARLPYGVKVTPWISIKDNLPCNHEELIAPVVYEDNTETLFGIG